ncbi:MAG: hypothetical protein Q8P13_02515 [bacterium]|nr:hypothetical protein [bacterium]
MKYIFVFIDCLTVIFASATALQFGTNYQPNLGAFILVFLFSRTLLQWLVFESFIHRTFPTLRAAVQFAIILLVLPFLLFAFSVVPFLTPILEHPFYFYYLLIPVVVLLLSSLFQIFFKLESWVV